MLLGLTMVLGFLFVCSVLSIPLPLLVPDATMSEGMRVGIAVGCALQAAFWGYATRGALRSYRGQHDAHLIPPSLLRPVAFVVGVLFTLAGIGGLVAGQRGMVRAIGLGGVLLAYVFTTRKAQPPST